MTSATRISATRNRFQVAVSRAIFLNLARRVSPARLRLRGLLAVPATTLLVVVLGCSGSMTGPLSADHFSVRGVVHGAMQPIANANVYLYAVDSQNSSAVSNVELAASVRSDGEGAFQFPVSVACPAPDALIYVVVKGGVPTSTGLANPSIGLLNVLGTCSALTAKTTATINEVTTVGSAWPLAAFANDSGQFLPESGEAAQFVAAAATVGKLVNSDLGTTPGRLLERGDVAPVITIYSLANAIASCVVTGGGSAGDGSACGQLFSLAGSDSARLPADTLTAALRLAKNPARNVSNLYNLSTSKAVFRPSLTSAPADWTLATRSAGTLPAVTTGATASMPSDNSSPSSTTPGVSRATAQATPLVANTIVIKTGGTYQGNWVSTDPTIAAVTIQTDQPVVIQNSTVSGRGNLIGVTGTSGANLTLQNVTGTGLDPLVAGKARGAFLVAYVMNSLTVQNCTMTGTRFGIKLGFSTASSVHILNNQAINLEDRASDGNGGFQTTRPQLGHFVYLYQVVATNGAEISWNQMVQTMGQSSVDNAIEIYKSQGTSAKPILVHDNYVEGMSSPASTNYVASGYAATGDNTMLESTFINFVSNEVVHTAGSGLTILNGHDITAQTNRVVSCGQNSGTWYTKAGVYATVLWNRSGSPSFYNNTITTTAGGLIIPNTANKPATADSSANPVDLQTASNSVSGNLFTDPCLVGGVLTLSAEDTERAFWTTKLTNHNIVLGDQHVSQTVILAPLSLTTTGLNSTEVGVAYSAAMQASGGTPPYNWSIASGTMPAGLSLNRAGVITGTATVSGTSTFTVKVADVGSPTETQNRGLSMIVLPSAAQMAIVHYLSPTGNDGNDGLTPQTAWWSPNHSGLTCGVDTIIAEPSSAYGILGYVQFYADWGKVNCSGGNSVVWLKCAQAFACKDVNMPLAFTVNQSYWGVSGFEVDSSQIAGFAAASTNGATIHHIIFANNICKNCGGAGFTTFNSGDYGVDYVNFIGNLAYNSAFATGVCGSGISIAAPAQSDAAPGTHIYVAGNFSIANMNPPRCAGTAATDGNGLILDTFSALSYTMQTVAANNLLIGNGGRGLEILNGTAPTYTFNNTMWGNNTDPNQSTTWAGEYLVALANHVTSRLDLASTNAWTAYGGNPLSAFYLVGTTSTTSLSNDWANAVAGVSINPGSGAVLANDITSVSPMFANPSIPTEPACDVYSTTVACMATVIANFTPTNSAAKIYGYQRPSLTPVRDSLFPQWLCTANLPSGLITLGCL